jgi:putative component of toxin-antitoxin plasmid stabilization module
MLQLIQTNEFAKWLESQRDDNAVARISTRLER